MDRQQIDFQGCSRTHGTRHRVGDVVELQVEEQTAPHRIRRFDRGADAPRSLGAAPGEKLESHLVKSNGVAQAFDHAQGRHFVRHVERENDFVFRVRRSCHKMGKCLCYEMARPG